MRISDWSSDVCSSDLLVLAILVLRHEDELIVAHRRRGGDVPHALAAAGGGNAEGHFEFGVRTAVDEAELARERLGSAEAEADRTAQDMLHMDGLRSEEHTSELQSLMRISYAVF